jgi:hypothetical protein
MMLAKPNGMHANFVGQRRLFDDIANNLRLRHQLAIRPGGDVAECVQSELDFLRHSRCFSCMGLAAHEGSPRLDLPCRVAVKSAIFAT